ncbi:MAG: translation initiation factor Sui1 [Polaromonas sp.]|nr:translation initiation factor Sui1 [Polaromonas sp.]MDP3753665.1 translation initiation factor Sui1 [Polaromonas sp.]
MKSAKMSGGLVYSTDAGRMCPACRRPIAQCVCRQAKPTGAADGIVRVVCETKGRGGKSVTVIRGLALDTAALTLLGKQLKAACGSGGTVKDGVIEVQGEHMATVMALLQKQGWTVKQAGGKAA